MKRNVVRIRVNGKNLIKISYGSDKSYIVAFPRMEKDDSYVECHASFHTRNNRITFKITDFGDSKRNFASIVEESRVKGYHITLKGDIDLYRERYIDEEDLRSQLVNIGRYSYDFRRDEFLEKTIGDVKTKDSKFQQVIDLRALENSRVANIAVFVSKNLLIDPKDLVESAINLPVHEQFFVTDIQGEDVYTFTVLVRYTDKLEET